jgi:hypothetical protein
MGARTWRLTAENGGSRPGPGGRAVENSFDCDDYNLSAPISCGPPRAGPLRRRVRMFRAETHCSNVRVCGAPLTPQSGSAARLMTNGALITGCMRMNSTIDSFERAHYGNLLQVRHAPPHIHRVVLPLLHTVCHSAAHIPGLPRRFSVRK